jgi:hypothetical protein
MSDPNGWPDEAAKALAAAADPYMHDALTRQAHQDFRRDVLAALAPFVAAALAQARRDALEEAANMIDCGCAQAAEVVAVPPNSGRRWELCGQSNCGAIEAAAIRTKAQEAPVVSNLDANHLAWTVERWRAEVLARPLRNIHRRALDGTWRQVMRRMGGDPDALVGPCHDELLAMDIKP